MSISPPGVSYAQLEAVAAPTVLDSAEVTEDSTFSHPLPEAIVKGTFIAPTSGRVDITVDLHGSNAGYAYANLSLVVGIPTNGLLRGTGQYAPLIAGADRRLVGRAAFDTTVDLQRRYRFDDLTPGETYAWQLETVIVGGSDSLSVTTPTGVVFIEAENRGYIFSSDTTVNGIYPFTMAGRPGWLAADGPVDHTLGTKITHPSGPYGLYRPAITPNGAYVVAQAVLSTGCVILNTATNAVTKVANPASGTAPYTAVCHSNTKAWVGFSGTGRLAELDLAAGTWGTPVNPGAAVIGMCLNETRDVMYVGRTDGVLLRYPNLADLTSGVTFLDVGGRIESLAWGGDRVWVAQSSSLKSVHPTTFATIDTLSVAATPNELRCTPDYKILWAILQNGTAAYWSTAAHDDLPVNNEFDHPDLGTVGTAIQVTTDGYIYACADSTVHIWPGSTLGILPESGDGPGGLAPAFLDHGLTVEVTAT